jgi:hypothetical protein
MVSRRTHSINLAMQAARLKSIFPLTTIAARNDKLTWRGTIVPSAASRSYEVKLEYVRDGHPNVYVLSPRLERFPGEDRLPHVYDTEQQRLCLYYKRAREWNPGMLIADTILPWTSEWLFFYEIWLGTGEWHGGGIHGTKSAESVTNGEQQFE